MTHSFVQVPARTWVWGSSLENGQPTSGRASKEKRVSVPWGPLATEYSASGGLMGSGVFLMPKKITYLNFYFLVLFC